MPGVVVRPRPRQERASWLPATRSRSCTLPLDPRKFRFCPAGDPRACKCRRRPGGLCGRWAAVQPERGVRSGAAGHLLPGGSPPTPGPSPAPPGRPAVWVTRARGPGRGALGSARRRTRHHFQTRTPPGAQARVLWLCPREARLRLGGTARDPRCPGPHPGGNGRPSARAPSLPLPLVPRSSVSPRPCGTACGAARRARLDPRSPLCWRLGWVCRGQTEFHLCVRKAHAVDTLPTWLPVNAQVSAVALVTFSPTPLAVPSEIGHLLTLSELASQSLCLSCHSSFLSRQRNGSGAF